MAKNELVFDSGCQRTELLGRQGIPPTSGRLIPSSCPTDTLTEAQKVIHSIGVGCSGAGACGRRRG